MNDFDYDCMQKKRTARSAFAHISRKRGGCTLPSDNLTAKQRREKNGEVKSYNITRPMPWPEFKTLPEDLKREFLRNMQSFGDYREGDVASSCKQRDYKDSTDLVASSVDCRNFTEGGEINRTLQAKERGGQSLNLQNTVRTGMIVRRLTPMECERLQGYPDGWTDIGDYTDSTGKKRKTSDSARYKALGNSIALPFWRWMFGRMAAYLPEGATLGSLFDGIGGFPLCWENIHGAGTAIWASEIEEFPIAVTKLRFGGAIT